MNSYEFHIGDYYRETRNLSQGEHYIYRSLLDECYLHEVPLTTDPKMLMRLIGIKSDQIEDLEFILDRFFMLTPDGWINNRVNEELARIYAKSAAAKASADARWEKHKKNANGMRTQCDRNANGVLPLDPLTPLPSDPVKKTATKRFVAPSLDEVIAYKSEKNLSINPAQFIDFYESKGWIVGKSKMRDWKAAARGWSQREEKSNEKNGQTYRPAKSHHAQVVGMLRDRIAAEDD